MIFLANWLNNKNIYNLTMYSKMERGIEKEDSTVMTVVGIRRGWTDKRL